jgi:4-hydroxybenzoate polyprenyltransferase
MLQAIIRNLRIKDSFVFLIGPLIAMVSLFSLFPDQFSVELVLKVISVFLIYSFYGFAINNYFDRDNDKHNPVKIKSNPMSTGEMSSRAGLAMSAALAAISVILVGIWMPGSLLAILFMLFLATIYSSSIKKRPVADIVIHGMFFCMYFVFIITAFQVGWEFAALGIVMFASVSNVMQILNQLMDYESDMKSGTKTSAVRFGKKALTAVYILSVLSFTISLIALFAVYNSVLFLMFLVLPAACIYALGKLRQKG